MSSTLLLTVILIYLAALFLIGYWAEKLAPKKWTNNSLVYVLGLGVYCSAWTYYGSVGIAATQGPEFITTYLGPIIALPLWLVMLKKVILVAKQYQLSSIADFISMRYGNSRSLGALVTLTCLIAVLPYIALQLKAVGETFNILSSQEVPTHIAKDSTLYIALILAFFVAWFGNRFSDASRQRTGLLFTVAVESLFKLLVFIAAGLYVVYGVFDGFKDLLEQASNIPNYSEITTIDAKTTGFPWFAMVCLSFFAIFLLPRQFQTGVVAFTSVKQLKTAIWAFPLYLVLFNVFVIFIAYGGRILLDPQINADYIALYLPLFYDNSFMATLVFLGGLSSIISMVVISALALSVMLTNNIILPYGFLKILYKGGAERNKKSIKIIRRITVFALILLAYFLQKKFTIELDLYSIGLICFVIIAQLAPSFFIGLFWNRGSAFGAKLGLGIGLLICAYTLLVPFGIDAFYSNNSFTNHGLFGIAFFKPYALFGLEGYSPITHCFIWSLLLNCSTYLIVSVTKKSKYRERNFAELVVNANQIAPLQEDAFIWKGKARVDKIRETLTRFIGAQRTERALDIFYRKYKLDPNDKNADPRLINFSEKLLTGTVGSSSAKMIVSRVVEEQPVPLPELLEILDETKETIKQNKQLEKQSRELANLTRNLKEANAALKEKDAQKDEFLDTVAHELKTPTASIRAATEVLFDNEDVPPKMRKQFLENILKDADRLSLLISNILDLEKLSNGRSNLELKKNDLVKTITSSIKGVEHIGNSKKIKITTQLPEHCICVYDHNRMVQVFTNILANAIKFCNSVQGKINVNVQQRSEKVLVRISDNGKGVPKEDVPYIFEKFYQSKNQNTKKPLGSGMGLAICKHIMLQHNGNIYLNEAHENGAEFIMELTTNQNK